MRSRSIALARLEMLLTGVLFVLWVSSASIGFPQGSTSPEVLEERVKGLRQRVEVLETKVQPAARVEPLEKQVKDLETALRKVEQETAVIRELVAIAKRFLIPLLVLIVGGVIVTALVDTYRNKDSKKEGLQQVYEDQFWRGGPVGQNLSRKPKRRRKASNREQNGI